MTFVNSMSISTVKASRVLKDAKAALEKFDANPIDVDFRHLVVLCLALLRAVGHVLDRENQGNNKAKATDYFKQHVEPAEIFRDFINEYRNSLLKTYSAKINWQSNTTLDNQHSMAYEMEDGVYSGRDIRELIREAIEFWQVHLDAMAKL